MAIRTIAIWVLAAIVLAVSGCRADDAADIRGGESRLTAACNGALGNPNLTVNDEGACPQAMVGLDECYLVDPAPLSCCTPATMGSSGTVAPFTPPSGQRGRPRAEDRRPVLEVRPSEQFLRDHPDPDRYGRAERLQLTYVPDAARNETGQVLVHSNVAPNGPRAEDRVRDAVRAVETPERIPRLQADLGLFRRNADGVPQVTVQQVRQGDQLPFRVAYIWGTRRPDGTFAEEHRRLADLTSVHGDPILTPVQWPSADFLLNPMRDMAYDSNSNNALMAVYVSGTARMDFTILRGVAGAQPGLPGAPAGGAEQVVILVPRDRTINDLFTTSTVERVPVPLRIVRERREQPIVYWARDNANPQRRGQMRLSDGARTEVSSRIEGVTAEQRTALLDLANNYAELDRLAAYTQVERDGLPAIPLMAFSPQGAPPPPVSWPNHGVPHLLDILQVASQNRDVMERYFRIKGIEDPAGMVRQAMVAIVTHDSQQLGFGSANPADWRTARLLHPREGGVSAINAMLAGKGAQPSRADVILAFSTGLGSQAHGKTTTGGQTGLNLADYAATQTAVEALRTRVNEGRGPDAQITLAAADVRSIIQNGAPIGAMIGMFDALRGRHGALGPAAPFSPCGDQHMYVLRGQGTNQARIEIVRIDTPNATGADAVRSMPVDFSGTAEGYNRSRTYVEAITEVTQLVILNDRIIIRLVFHDRGQEATPVRIPNAYLAEQALDIGRDAARLGMAVEVRYRGADDREVVQSIPGVACQNTPP